jgi:adenylyltransferase/sulfurtransferase
VRTIKTGWLSEHDVILATRFRLFEHSHEAGSLTTISWRVFEERKQSMTTMTDMTPEELKRRRDAGEDIFVLDVREQHEYQTANIGGHLIPLNDLPKRVGELDPNRETVVHCKMGGRSAKAVDFLRQSGFTKVHNMVGGINAWSERVDPKVPKY